MIEIQEFLDACPDNTEKIKVKLGSTRTRMPVLHVFDEIPAEHEIEDRLEDGGFGDPHEFAMLVAIDGNGKQIKTKSLTRYLKAAAGQEDPIRAFGEEYRLLLAESRRMVTVNNDLTESLLTNNRFLTEMNMKLRENIFESETESVALKLAMQQVEEEGSHDIKREGIAAIYKLAEAWAKNSSSKETMISEIYETATADQLAEMFKSRPDLIDEAMDHAELVTMFTAGLMAKEAGINADS